MEQVAARDRIQVGISSMGMYFLNGHITSLTCFISIFESVSHKDSVCIIIRSFPVNIKDQKAYIVDHNALALIRSKAPVSIVVDAILEVPESQWEFCYGPGGTAEILATLHAAATMDFIPRSHLTFDV